MPKIDIDNPRAGFSSIVLTVDGIEVLVKSVNYGDGVERMDIEGNARMALGVSEGMYKADDCAVELYLAEYDQVIDAFKAEFYSKPFTITVGYEVGSKTRTDTLVGCRWTKRDNQNQGGADALTRTLTCKPMYVRVNGQDPLKNMPAGAK